MQKSQLIQSVCAEALNSNFCTNILESDPRSAFTTDVLTIYRVVLELALAHAQKSLVYAQHTFTSSAMPEILEPLDKCVNRYSLTVHLLQSAFQEVKRGETMAAIYDSKLAGDSIQDCEQAFSVGKVNDVEVSKNNEIGWQFVWIILSIQNFI
ncbi:hypothetical protein SLE2022_277460 [Rubroshorea leprosula]